MASAGMAYPVNHKFRREREVLYDSFAEQVSDPGV